MAIFFRHDRLADNIEPAYFRLMQICLFVTGFVLLAILPANVRAEDNPACPSCRMEDENQAGTYTQPYIPTVPSPDLTDPKGHAYQLPVPGGPTVHHRPGAGIWLGEIGTGNNVFVNPKRDQLSVGVKHDF